MKQKKSINNMGEELLRATANIGEHDVEYKSLFCVMLNIKAS